MYKLIFKLFVLFLIITFTISCKPGITPHGSTIPYDSLKVLNTHIHYQYANSGFQKTIVFIHGGMLDLEMWDKQKVFFEKDYNVLYFDMPGHGHSGSRNESMLDYQYLEILMNKLGIEKSILVGSSLGSIIATEFTLELPHRVEKLIMVSPGINQDAANDPKYLEFTKGYIDNMKLNRYDEAANSLTRIVLTGPNRGVKDLNEDDYNLVFEKIKNHIVKAYWKSSPQLINPGSNGRLSEIWVPTLLVIGEEDFVYVKNISTILASKISDVETISIPDAAHLNNLEKPGLFNKALLSFIDRKN